jgi:hypothetical protein
MRGILAIAFLAFMFGRAFELFGIYLLWLVFGKV